jgi:pimeloyl-ACP methyl ester carboxylesterase
MNIRFTVSLAFSIISTALIAGVPIDTSREFTIGNIKQYVTIKAKDRSNPLLLFLHGGPGGSVMSYSHKFTSRLEEHFVIVQWDQRETGETLKLNASPERLTATLFVNDTRALIDTLLQVFRQPKILLVGHSWGTYLGFEIARTHPETVHGFVAIGPMINQVESERQSLEILLEAARKANDKSALSELKWLLKHQGSKAKLSKEYVLNWCKTWLDVFNKASEINLFEEAPTLNCPVYFFLGRKDLQTSSVIAEQYYQTLKAPEKKIFWFEKSAHGIPSSEPDKLQTLIIEEILPSIKAKTTVTSVTD